MTTMMARVLLAVLAVAVIAWLGVLIRDTRLSASAGAVLFRTPPPTQRELQAALADLSDAQLLTPDPTPKVNQARFELFRGRDRAALTLADQVVSDEPANLDAWAVVFQAGQIVDPSRAQQARAAILRLNPQVGRSSRR